MKFSVLSGLRIVLITAALLSTGVRGVNGEVVDRIVAVVNDDIITLTEFNAVYDSYAKRIVEFGYPSDQERDMLFKLRENIIDQLVDKKLTDQEVQRLSLSVTDQELDNAIERIKERGMISDEDLRDQLKAEGLTMEKYRKDMKEQLLRAKLVELQVKSNIIVTDEDIHSYYESHPEEFAQAKRVHLRNIIMRTTPFGTEDEKQAVFARMKAVQERLAAGESFVGLAGEVSESSNRSDGGDLGTFEITALAAPIQAALAGKKKGEYTDIIDTEQGYQIFYIEDTTSDSEKKIEDVAPGIQEKLYRTMLDEKFNTWLAELRKRSHIKIIN